MRKVEFTQEFYKAVAKELKAFAEGHEFVDSFEVDTTISVEFEGKKYELDIEATFGREWHDDSFDHAFGTWHDPYPYWDYNGYIEDLGEVSVFDISEGGDGEQVEGFDENAFWSQFDRDWYCQFKAGDKVIYRNNEYEFVAYNTEACYCKLRDANGKEIGVQSDMIRKKVA